MRPHNRQRFATEHNPDKERKRILGRVVFRVIWNKELLLYAQRHYLADRFRDYDPSEKDMWEDYNCPWDYDHILAHYYTYYKQGKMKKFSGKWVGTIGNLRAWPAEDNRSDQKDLAKDKIKTEALAGSFLEKTEIPQFSCGASVRDKADDALSFAMACWQRTVRIYKDWFDSMDIKNLLKPTELSESAPKPLRGTETET